MAAMDFPNAPTLNQKYLQYTWDGEKWIVQGVGGGGGGGSAVYTSDTPPASAPDNSLWVETDTGMMFVRWNDGNSSQWVAIPGGITDAVRYATAQTLTSGQQSQARANIYAAPYDAMAYGGMQINSCFEVAQEYGANIVSPGWLNFTGYFADGWQTSLMQATAGATAFSVGNSGAGLTGFRGSAQVIATGAANFAAATDKALVYQIIEGYRFFKAGFGNADALPVTISFWVYATATGTAHVLLGGNGTVNRCYIKSFTVNAANTWEYKTLTFPPDTLVSSVNWLYGNGPGATVAFCFGGGATTKGGVLDTWATWVSQYASSTQSNFFAANGNQIYLTGVTVLAGTDAPSAARSSLLVRPYGDELALCQRYYYKTVAQGFGMAATPLSVGGSIIFPVSMRAVPTLSGSWAVNSGNAGTFAAQYPTTEGAAAWNGANNWTVNAIVSISYTANARL